MTAPGCPRVVVLVGMMGTGKTTVARILSGVLGCEMRDTDRMVEAAEKRSVREVFEELGEEAFRRTESEQLKRAVSGDDRCVVAAAGGIVLRDSNRSLLNGLRREGQAFVVWLVADVASLTERTARGGHRPLLDDDREATLARVASEREPLYSEVADLRVDTVGFSARQVAEHIVETLNDIVEGSGGKNA